jgi:hypothetical protein
LCKKSKALSGSDLKYYIKEGFLKLKWIEVYTNGSSKRKLGIIPECPLK